ncbi:MAG: AmmeMemoRadiSam system radical SAM enzyme [Bacteroidetes bacterium]|nr:AmmeMemoRadiSam system radical SAM enzyme [Bacteroidota bacterium]
MEAKYYSRLEGSKVKCELCPHNCIIDAGKYGICKVRRNDAGILDVRNFEIVSSLGFDPIEKKPLYHFYTGAEILSVGSLGCNLQCQFCQNWQISQTSVKDFEQGAEKITVNEIINIAQSRAGNVGIAYTYNEPVIFYEFMLEIAKRANELGLKNVMVTNGFINPEPLNELHQYIDAYSVDLKAFNNDFFAKYTKSKLAPVLDTLISIAKADKHLEVTNLIIPGLNDDSEEFEQMVKWIQENLGKQTVLHISRYYPTYKLNVQQTSVDKMLELNSIAKTYLDFVYLGNVLLEDGNNTFCPDCGELLVKRTGYMTRKQSVNNQGDCIKCGTHVFNFLNPKS